MGADPRDHHATHLGDEPQLDEQLNEVNDHLDGELDAQERAEHQRRMAEAQAMNQAITANFQNAEWFADGPDEILADAQANDGSASAEADPQANQELDRDASKVSEVAKEVADRPPDERKLYVMYALAGTAALGAVGSIGGATAAILAYQYATRLSDGRSTDDLGLSADQDAQFSALIRAWLTKSDDDLWQEMAVFAHANEKSLTLADEVIMLRLIERMSPAAAWLWNSDRDKDAAVAASAGDFQAPRTTSPMYQKIRSRTFTNANDGTTGKLPRQIAAEVLKLAIARILTAA